MNGRSIRSTGAQFHWKIFRGRSVLSRPRIEVSGVFSLSAYFLVFFFFNLKCWNFGIWKTLCYDEINLCFVIVDIYFLKEDLLFEKRRLCKYFYSWGVRCVRGVRSVRGTALFLWRLGFFIKIDFVKPYFVIKTCRC